MLRPLLACPPASTSSPRSRGALVWVAALLLLGAPLAACDEGAGPAGPLEPPATEPSDPPEVAPPTTEPELDGPRIDRVEPGVGSTAGLDQVQIIGAGLATVTTVLFGETAAPEHFAVHDGLIVALSPPRPSGLVDVTVFDAAGGLDILELAYVYRDEVQVTLVEPDRGHPSGGDPITVHGAGFSAEAVVVVGGRAALDVRVVDSQTITATTPPGAAGPATLFVSTRDGVAPYPPGFRFQGPPAIEAISPSAGPLAGGQGFELFGEGFEAPVVVRVGGVLVEDAELVDEGTIVGTLPARAAPGPVDVAVSGPMGSVVAPGAFHYLAGVDGLTVLGVHPRRGRVAGGDRVSVAVAGLVPGRPLAVAFGEAAAEVLEVDPEAMRLVVETSAGAPGLVAVSVWQDDEEATLAGAFERVAGPGVSSVSPGEGPVAGGTRVTIRGSGFAAGVSVRFGALPATGVAVLDDGTIEATTPHGSPGPATVRVSGGGLDAELEGGFTFRGAPAVWVVDPPRGARAGGTRVDILGHGFAAGIPEVRFGGGLATDVLVVHDGLITARTPSGEVGPARVAVQGAGYAAAHPNGFVYFDPGSVPGTWGGPIDGHLNVTVIESRSGMPLTGAVVVVGPEVGTTLRGYTDARGQITFSAPALRGRQTVSAGRAGHEAMQVAGFDAENVTLTLARNPTCSDLDDMPCDMILPPPRSARFEGRLLGSAKGPTIPWGECRDWPDAPAGLCLACGQDADCGGDRRCAELPGEGFFCTAGCVEDAECAGDFRCVDVTGLGGPGQCVPPPGEPATYCDITEPSMWAEDTIPYPGVAAQADNTVAFTTRLGSYAVYCWHGVRVRGFFRPRVMGLARQLGAYEDGVVVRADIHLDIPLRQRVAVEIDRPTMANENGERTLLRTILNLGGDGVAEFPPLRAFGKRNFEVVLPEPRGVLHDTSWDFFVVVEVDSLGGYSASIERNIRAIANDVDLRLTEEGWEPVRTVPATTRGVAPRDDDVLVVGDAGRIARSFGQSHWAVQSAGTERDLHAIATHPAGGAIAVGAGGVATHWGGMVWEPTDTGVIATLEGVAFANASVAWAVGGRHVLRYDGAAWSEVLAPDRRARAVWAGAEDDVWVVGDGGLALRFDGASWEAVPTPGAADLYGIWAPSAEAWGPIAVGAGGAILRWDGAAFVEESSPTSHHLLAVWGSASDRVFAVGRRGTVLRFDGERWRDESDPRHRGTLRAVGGAGDAVWAMGSHELVLGPMLAIPTGVTPSAGGLLVDALRWSVPESVAPHFSLLEFGDAVGPCFACGMGFMLPYTRWRSVLHGDLFEASFPRVENVPEGSGLGVGLKSATLYRVRVDGRFDFDHTARNGFFGVDWRSWSARGVSFVR